MPYQYSCHCRRNQSPPPKEKGQPGTSSDDDFGASNRTVGCFSVPTAGVDLLHVRRRPMTQKKKLEWNKKWGGVANAKAPTPTANPRTHILCTVFL